MNVKELSQSYEAPKDFKNIVELDVFNLDTEIKVVEYETKQGEKFSVNEAEIDGVVYRVPNSVLGQIKTILEMKPDTKQISVGKSGSGLNTTYTAVPL